MPIVCSDCNGEGWVPVDACRHGGLAACGECGAGEAPCYRCGTGGVEPCGCGADAVTRVDGEPMCSACAGTELSREDAA